MMLIGTRRVGDGAPINYPRRQAVCLNTRIAVVYGPPVIADMVAGYGKPLMISRAVKQYARDGVVGFYTDVQVSFKRSGHLFGKDLVKTGTYLGRIRVLRCSHTVQKRRRHHHHHPH